MPTPGVEMELEEGGDASASTSAKSPAWRTCPASGLQWGPKECLFNERQRTEGPEQAPPGKLC